MRPITTLLLSGMLLAQANLYQNTFNGYNATPAPGTPYYAPSTQPTNVLGNQTLGGR